ncbi:MAG: hypothetical protein WC819_04000 [Parcubacteria group bacterium]|jgi:hypothetical protein
MEAEREVLCKAFMKIVEDSYFTAFILLKLRGEITPQLEKDFLAFHQTVLEMFSIHGIKFSMNRVFEYIPLNTWIPAYLKYLSTETENAPTSEESYSSLPTNPVFQEICATIRAQKSN